MCRRTFQTLSRNDKRCVRYTIKQKGTDMTMKWKDILMGFIMAIAIVALSAVVLILVPIGINYIVLSPTPEPLKLADPSNGWLNFFAVYYGSVITAIVSFVVLYKTIKNNHKENNTNRQLQTAILKYQINKEKNNVIKELFARYIYSIDYFGIKSLAKTFDNNKQAFFYSIRQHLENTSVAYHMLEFNLNDFKEDKERQFIDRINTFRISYNELLMDLIWMLQPYNHKGTDEENRDIYIDQLKECEANASDFNKGTNRIWYIVQQYDYMIKNNSYKIINECIDKFDFRAIEKIANDFFDYENSKNEALINISE